MEWLECGRLPAAGGGYHRDTPTPNRPRVHESKPNPVAQALPAGGAAASTAPVADGRYAGFELCYRAPGAPQALAPDTLALIRFGHGDDGGAGDDARLLRVGLDPLAGSDCVELWRGTGPVRCGRHGEIRYADDGRYQFAAIEVDEREHGGSIERAAEHAYRSLWAFKGVSDFPCPLRIWNYFDAINAGEGDEERYKLFVRGRARALSEDSLGQYPAATAIGRRDGSPIVQVYWLAARGAGLALENPRQVSAYRYPRRYGPVAPGFSRAMLAPDIGLLISGTASVVGHASRHEHDAALQLDECLANLEHVLKRGAEPAPALQTRFGPASALKMYVRNEAEAAHLTGLLRAKLAPGTPLLVLQGDVCRTELLVEIEAVQPLR